MQLVCFMKVSVIAAFHYAAYSSNVLSGVLLLRYGADVDAGDEEGRFVFEMRTVHYHFDTYLQDSTSLVRANKS